MKFDFSFKLINFQEIKASLRKEMNQNLRRFIRGFIPSLTVQVRSLIVSKLSEVLLGELKDDIDTQFGVPNIGAIINAFAEKTYLDFDEFLKTRLSISIVMPALNDLENDPGAYYNSIGRFGVNKVPWVEWLTSGTGVVIPDFRIKFGNFSPETSRSGKAIMIPGKGWSVPGNLAGGPKDNIFTVALIGLEKEIEMIFKSTIQGSPLTKSVKKANEVSVRKLTKHYFKNKVFLKRGERKELKSAVSNFIEGLNK